MGTTGTRAAARAGATGSAASVPWAAQARPTSEEEERDTDGSARGPRRTVAHPRRPRWAFWCDWEDETPAPARAAQWRKAVDITNKRIVDGGGGDRGNVSRRTGSRDGWRGRHQGRLRLQQASARAPRQPGGAAAGGGAGGCRKGLPHIEGGAFAAQDHTRAAESLESGTADRRLEGHQRHPRGGAARGHGAALARTRVHTCWPRRTVADCHAMH
eukprot:scaffold2645_cov378-Prasinococcus_capsulatus_cf.AAC.15